MKKLWERIKGFFFKKEEIPEPIEEVIIEEPEPEPEEELPPIEGVEIGMDGLMNSFYGTLADRINPPPNITRKRHLPNGWRHGKSHPFQHRGEVYDVQDGIDKNVKLFRKLMRQLEEDNESK